MPINLPTILHFNRKPLVPYRQDEVYFRLNSSLGKMRDVQMWDACKEVPHCTFCDASRQISQVWRGAQIIGLKWNHFLQPGSPKPMIANTEFCGAALTLQPQLQRLHHAQKHRPFEKSQVCENALPTDIGVE